MRPMFQYQFYFKPNAVDGKIVTATVTGFNRQDAYENFKFQYANKGELYGMGYSPADSKGTDGA